MERRSFQVFREQQYAAGFERSMHLLYGSSLPRRIAVPRDSAEYRLECNCIEEVFIRNRRRIDRLIRDAIGYAVLPVKRRGYLAIVFEIRADDAMALKRKP
jgi:hypothetical protein